MYSDLGYLFFLTETDEKQYLKAIDVASKLLPTGQVNLLKLSLSLKSLTPLVQAHLQIAKELLEQSESCTEEAFVQIGDEIICDLSLLGKTIHKRKHEIIDVELFSFDHIYPGSNNNSLTVVLYGQLGKKLFNDYHKKLVDQAEKGLVKYVVRNYVKTQSKKKVRLSGYGVEMHLKSTEYKSQDDSPRQADSHSRQSDESQLMENEVEGMNFAVLKERLPHLTHSLDRLRLDLLEKHDEIEPLKPWEFQELGMQAADRLAQIQGEEALSILQFTSQNFPSQAKTLLNIAVAEDFKEEMKHNTEVFARSLNLQPPDAALFLNGLFFDADTLDIFSLLESLRSESRVLEGLHKIGLSGKQSEPLLALDLSASSAKEFAIDIRDSAITWINDIENDAQYKRWPSSVLDLLRPTFPGMMRNVRKNMLNLVSI